MLDSSFLSLKNSLQGVCVRVCVCVCVCVRSSEWANEMSPTDSLRSKYFKVYKAELCHLGWESGYIGKHSM